MIELLEEAETRYKERLKVWAKSRNLNMTETWDRWESSKSFWGGDDCIFERKLNI